MKRGKPAPFVTDAERRERLHAQARAAAESFRRIGRVIPAYDRPDVLGTAIGLGLLGLDELLAAHANVSASAVRRIRGEV